MSDQRQGGDQDKDMEEFYDCQDTLAPRGDRRQGEQSDRLKEEQSDRLQQEQSDRLQENAGRQEEEEEEEEQSNRLQESAGRQVEEEQSDRLQENAGQQEEEEEQWEMKQDEESVEFDDEYLKEVEKELTEEEKESRRQQSLSLKDEGNVHFKAGEWLKAEQSYREALLLCPVCFSQERAVLFSNRAAARLHLGLKDQALSDCSRAIDLKPDYVRALLRRAELHEQTEKLEEALQDYKKVVELDPDQIRARQACMRLPQQIHERNEKLKEEMISKLKDLGNMILQPFGLSTNNFQVNQDSGSGSYSVNFVQNPNNNR
ncbi:tetratricopeptide repeat protein 1 [Genypterus blacodes]|uniref:tetratricopeptide repeat protein 1 n=1 Tax=Genypterus blacodes TaxID=154954 RepID=UPI003F76B2F5